MSHIKRECRLWKREQVKEKAYGQKNDKENIATIVDSDLGIVYNESSVNLTFYSSDWVIDSDASFHVTKYRDYFTSHVNSDYGHKRYLLRNYVGYKLLLKNVRHVLNIRLNLISTRKLDDDGYTNQFDKGKWKLTKGFLVLDKERKTNTLYVVECKIKKKDQQRTREYGCKIF